MFCGHITFLFNFVSPGSRGYINEHTDAIIIYYYFAVLNLQVSHCKKGGHSFFNFILGSRDSLAFERLPSTENYEFEPGLNLFVFMSGSKFHYYLRIGEVWKPAHLYP